MGTLIAVSRWVTELGLKHFISQLLMSMQQRQQPENELELEEATYSITILKIADQNGEANERPPRIREVEDTYFSAPGRSPGPSCDKCIWRARYTSVKNPSLKADTDSKSSLVVKPALWPTTSERSG